VSGQIHGGVAQGVGQALGEQIVYDRDSGQMLTASFMDYQMPRAWDFPNFQLPRGKCDEGQPARRQGCRRGWHVAPLPRR